MEKTRILILGGGFGGIYTAMELCKALKKRPSDDLEIVMVNKENYTVYTPMLGEVISGNLSPLDVSIAIRDLCPRINLYVQGVEHIDFDRKVVITSINSSSVKNEIPYDHLVLAMGLEDNFSIVRGLSDHGLHFKSVADALILRYHIINLLEHADTEKDEAKRRKMLTFVVAGGGFSGVEAIGEMNDYVRGAARRYNNIKDEDIKMILLHGYERILPEFPPSLSDYSYNILKGKKIDIRLNVFIEAVTSDEAVLRGGTVIPTKTVVATIGGAPGAVLKALPLKKERGRIVVNQYLAVTELPNIWALGDCAYIMDNNTNKPCPPTAQFAVREGRRLAKNIIAEIDGSPKKPFSFKDLGMMGALGHHSAAGVVLGIKVSGLLGWMMWRFVYWSKLPGTVRKIRVAFDWILDFFVPLDIVNINLDPTENISKMHFEPGEMIFHEGDPGDKVFVILSGDAVVLKGVDQKPVGNLTIGDCFGEGALMHDRPRSASVRTVTAVDVLTVERKAFKALFTNVPVLREAFASLIHQRKDIA
ncbi:FAD-dependent oxidoreductase [Candidatus Magnetominusculus xianensis]|uniref:NADH:ubiquinone reductase (non-electrogenic) n=1 Tax=Candidatus Magnetominusculus xianensis TaxID=1748249 RepID=A0ABR5SHE4_9BACT|nr:FAD-dependent oxidoreductase [Candidatus Magnetominusculus xianensis]KWT87249.1 nucleotide-disulfide oxidoreductase [Candidatus Magnetominusculus xianensis]MBF0405052.1 FAD-dependent oxidoreductase [Nitrospirota bacterium]